MALAARDGASGAGRTSRKPANFRPPEGSGSYRARFEGLIAEISSRFIDLATEGIDRGIEDALKKIGNFARVDRSCILLFRNGRVSDTHEWCAPGIPSHKHRLQGISVKDFPYWMERLKRLNKISLSRTRELPESALAEKAQLESLGVKSLLAVPMTLKGSLVGFLGFFSSRKEMDWTDDNASLLKTVGEIFVSALERKRAEEVSRSTERRRALKHLRESENKYRALFEGVPVGLYRTSPDGRLLDLNPTMARMLGFEDKESALGRAARDFYLDPADFDRSAALMAKDRVLRDFEFQVKRIDGQVTWARDNAHAVVDAKGRLLHCEGSLSDITRQKQEEKEMQNRAEQVIRHQAALLEMAKIGLSDLDSTLQRMTEISARTLGIDRVSIWFFGPEHTEIVCRDLFLRAESVHDKGMVLKAEDYPSYFKALEESRVIAADRARTDPRTREFAESYLKPKDIVSTMDVPVRHRGQVVGIISHEHAGKERKWSLEEQHFAVSVGDAVSLALEAAERKRMERVNESIFQISEAANSARNLQALFHSIHQVISRLMPANNFYISLYDSVHRILSFPYFVDEFDTPPEPQPLGRGLTEYVLRTGQPLLASPEVFAELERRGEVESVGPASIDWLGVPLNINGDTMGVLVVQTYTEGLRYSEEDKNILKFVCDQIAMVIHRKKTEEDVQERERFLSSMFESIQDGISILTEDFTILRVNKTIENWYAHARPLVGKKCYEAYHSRDKACDVCPTRKTVETSETAYEVVPKVGVGGEVTGWLDLYSFPLVDKRTGLMKGVIEYVRDITERKKAEDRLQRSLQEKEVLLREIHHRVKNNMQVISSLLNLQSRHVTDPGVLEMFRESQRRIRSMALIHERLYQSSDLSRVEFSQYLRNLATHLFHSYQVDASRVQLKIEAEEVHLDINTAIPCGLIVNELVSNALKHAFPEGRSGELRIDLHRAAGDGYLLKVKDDGAGFPEGLDFRRTETLGMQIVGTLVSQIDASIDLARDKGTEFTIHFREVSYGQRT
jgi:PAS domain S-box-containing protein